MTKTFGPAFPLDTLQIGEIIAELLGRLAPQLQSTISKHPQRYPDRDRKWGWMFLLQIQIHIHITRTISYRVFPPLSNVRDCIKITKRVKHTILYEHI